MNTRITLKTLPRATAQQVFDHIARHLLTQNALSVSDDDRTSCLYRHPKGLKCAAGSVIADDEYDPSFEGENWYCLVQLGRVPSKHAALIYKMQRVHDRSVPEQWPARLEKVAATFSLDPYVVNELKGR